MHQFFGYLIFCNFELEVKSCSTLIRGVAKFQDSFMQSLIQKLKGLVDLGTTNHIRVSLFLILKFFCSTNAWFIYLRKKLYLIKKIIKWEEESISNYEYKSTKIEWLNLDTQPSVSCKQSLSWLESWSKYPLGMGKEKKRYNVIRELVKRAIVVMTDGENGRKTWPIITGKVEGFLNIQE